MTRKAIWCVAVTGLLLGLLHVGLSWPIYKRLSLEALWFAGSGLAVVCCALMNLVALRNRTLSGRWMVVLADLLVACFFAAAWPLLQGPQVAAGFAVFSALAVYFALEPVWRKPAVAAPAAAGAPPG